MLKTMREKLNAERADVAIESLIIDAGYNGNIRDAVLEAMGEEDVDCGDEGIDPEFDKLIEGIPETEIDDNYDSFMEGKVVAKDELGDEKEMTLEDVENELIPETEEE